MWLAAARWQKLLKQCKECMSPCLMPAAVDTCCSSFLTTSAELTLPDEPLQLGQADRRAIQLLRQLPATMEERERC